MILRLLLASGLLFAFALLTHGQKPHPKSGDEYLDRVPRPIEESRRQMEAELVAAYEQYRKTPKNPDTMIWFGRRLAYLGRFRAAIDVYSRGIQTYPNDARFYRHRGHRYITLRKFGKAIADFQQAVKLTRGKPDEIEPDGQPNARNVPTSTLQFNIWYHLGLAYYLTRDNQKALDSYRECLKVSKSPDRLVAATHWLYMTLRRMRRSEEAAKVLEPIRDGMDVIENDGYYRLLLMYKGSIAADTLLAEVEKQASSAAAHSVLYGVGNWYSYNGNADTAVRVFQKILESDQWTSFGYIAAEADMRRLGAIWKN